MMNETALSGHRGELESLCQAARGVTALAEGIVSPMSSAEAELVYSRLKAWAEQCGVIVDDCEPFPDDVRKYRFVGFYFAWPGTKLICIDPGLESPEGKASVLAHEIGHYIQHLLGELRGDTLGNKEIRKIAEAGADRLAHRILGSIRRDLHAQTSRAR